MIVDWLLDVSNLVTLALGLAAFAAVRYSFGQWLTPHARRRLAEGWTPRQLKASDSALSLLTAGLVVTLPPSADVRLLLAAIVVALFVAGSARLRAARDLVPWCLTALVAVMLERAVISINFPALAT